MDKFELARRLILMASSVDKEGQYDLADFYDHLAAKTVTTQNMRLSSVFAMKKEVLSEKEYDGYVVRKENVSNFCDDESEVVVESAYTKNGDYIGDHEAAKFYVEEKGIAPELADKSHSVCSIGFCEKEDKWYGWSHRAIQGFGIGDEAYEEHPEGRKKGSKIKTMEEAKKAAMNFAESVS